METLGGDDLVCVTGDANPGIFTGGGDDVVDTDRDVVDAGPPNDVGDYVVSGEPGEPNSDEVHLHGGTSVRGASTVTLELHGLPSPQAVLDGGGGGELVLETTDAQRITIDTTAGLYSRDDDTAAISGFDDFRLTNEVETRYLTFRGSDRDETITMFTTRNSAYDVAMGGGDDEIAVETDRIHRRVNVFDGGDGVDQLGIVMPPKQVRLDLRRGRLLAGKTRNAVPAKAIGFEDADVVADHIDLTGTGDDNDLRADGCDVTVRALGGDDLVSPLTQLYERPLRCGGTWARFVGGAGDDNLLGDAGVDVLIGGRGRDVAHGGSGRDVCAAERMRRCEVRR